VGPEAAEKWSHKGPYAQDGFMKPRSSSFLCGEPNGVKETRVVGETGRKTDQGHGQRKEESRAEKVDYQEAHGSKRLSAKHVTLAKVPEIVSPKKKEAQKQRESQAADEQAHRPGAAAEFSG